MPQEYSLLRHWGESFPFYLPGTVFGEAGEFRCAAVIAGAHHCHGGEESPVARQIEPETLVLVVVAVFQIAVFLKG